MRCYYHSDAEAVGVCSSCGRGLCAKSAVEVEGKLACKGCCEEVVARAARPVGGERRQKYGVYITALDAVFLAWRTVVWPYHRLHELALILFAIGVIVVCWGLVKLSLALGAVSLGLGSIVARHPHRHGPAEFLFLLGAFLIGWGFVRLSHRLKTSTSGFARSE